MTALQQRCADALNALGPKPPWWRVFKRRAWMRKARPIAALVIAEAMRIAFEQVFEASIAPTRAWQARMGSGLRVVKDEEVN